MIEIDERWLAANPLPPIEGDTSKNARGRVLLAGGAATVPGALRLTGEAALRVGAGKVRIGTVASATVALGVAFPEAAVLALPEENGEIGAGAAAVLAESFTRADAVVLGPGMSDTEAAARLVREVAAIDAPEATLVLDAAAIACAGGLIEALAPWRGRLLMTPHHGEMAALCGCDAEALVADPVGRASEVADRFEAVVVLKDAETLVVASDRSVLHYAGGGPGLGTGGSGDVLAGIVAGLVARGAAPLVAAGWAVWLHGSAGKRLADEVGFVGFLGRELLPLLPKLMERASPASSG